MPRLERGEPVDLADHSGCLTVARRGPHVDGFALVHNLAHDEPWQSILTAMAEHPAAGDALARPDRALVVHELAVRQGSRGRGTARKCLHDVLCGHDEQHVFINVYQTATDALAVFQRWGLTQVGSFRGSDSGVTLLVLTLPLEALRTRLRSPSTARQ